MSDRLKVREIECGGAKVSSPRSNWTTFVMVWLPRHIGGGWSGSGPGKSHDHC